jgi:hypothetical protein
MGQMGDLNIIGIAAPAGDEARRLDLIDRLRNGITDHGFDFPLLGAAQGRALL